MSENTALKEKLGLNVFKHETEQENIKIKLQDSRLKKALIVCPAGLYSANENEEVELTLDGCLECGTCKVACGTEVLHWSYPKGGTGVQYRFG